MVTDKEIREFLELLKKTDLKDRLIADAEYEAAVACRDFRNRLEDVLLTRLGHSLLIDSQTED